MNQIVRATLAMLGVPFLFCAADMHPMDATVATKAELQDAFVKAIAAGGGSQFVQAADIGKGAVTVGVDFVNQDTTPGIRLTPNFKPVASEHDRVSEVMEVLSGTATLVTGGEVVGAVADTRANSVALNGPTLRAQSIARGTSRRLGPGDVVVIPAGVYHWFSAVDSDLRLLMIRVDPDRVLAAKQ